MTVYYLNPRKATLDRLAGAGVHVDIPLIFQCRDNGGYVRLDGDQICEGGGYSGSTLILGSGAELPAVVRRWWRQFKAAAFS